jgi:hypothetical protein
MTIRFDEKGKFFTDVITKEAVAVVIQTVGFIIHGRVHVRPNERLKDELNTNEQFLAVTDAIIFDSDGAEKYHSDFLSVNRDHIVWVIPVEELNEEQPGGEY